MLHKPACAVRTQDGAKGDPGSVFLSCYAVGWFSPVEFFGESLYQHQDHRGFMGKWMQVQDSQISSPTKACCSDIKRE